MKTILNNKVQKLKFKCQGSGNCCVSRGKYGFVYLSYKDLQKLSKFFNITIEKFKIKYCDKTNNFIHLKELKKNNGNCIFLQNKKCTVYPARPIQCQTWPFWKENMNAKKWNVEISNFCPGIGKGKVYKKKEIVKIIEKDEKNEKSILDFNTNL